MNELQVVCEIWEDLNPGLIYGCLLHIIVREVDNHPVLWGNIINDHVEKYDENMLFLLL